MRKYKPSKIRTEKEKEIVSDIITELISIVQVLEMCPKSRKIEQKRWSEGCIYGMKYFIMRTAKMLNDPKKQKFYAELIKWKQEEEKLMKKLKHYTAIDKDFFIC